MSLLPTISITIHFQHCYLFPPILVKNMGQWSNKYTATVKPHKTSHTQNTHIFHWYLFDCPKKNTKKPWFFIVFCLPHPIDGGGIFRAGQVLRHLVLQRFEPPRRRQKLHPAEGPVRWGSKRNKQFQLGVFCRFFWGKCRFWLSVFLLS